MIKVDIKKIKVTNIWRGGSNDLNPFDHVSINLGPCEMSALPTEAHSATLQPSTITFPPI
jgi:hypothetical protein